MNRLAQGSDAVARQLFINELAISLDGFPWCRARTVIAPVVRGGDRLKKLTNPSLGGPAVAPGKRGAELDASKTPFRPAMKCGHVRPLAG